MCRSASQLNMRIKVHLLYDYRQGIQDRPSQRPSKTRACSNAPYWGSCVCPDQTYEWKKNIAALTSFLPFVDPCLFEVPIFDKGLLPFNRMLPIDEYRRTNMYKGVVFEAPCGTNTLLPLLNKAAGIISYRSSASNSGTNARLLIELWSGWL